MKWRPHILEESVSWDYLDAVAQAEPHLRRVVSDLYAQVERLQKERDEFEAKYLALVRHRVDLVDGYFDPKGTFHAETS